MSYSYDNFLKPLTASDKSIKILDNSNIVKYTIDPFSIVNLLVTNNIIKINLRSQKLILIDFNSKNEAILGLSILQQQVDSLKEKVSTQVDREIVNYVQSVFEQVSIGPTGATGPQGEIGSIGPTGATGIADKYSATSSTTLSIPQVGQYVILETQNNLSYYTAQNVSVYSDLPNLYNQDYEFDGGYFVGQIDYYNSNTGELSIVTDYSEGSGTFSFWYINLSGRSGIQGIQGVTGPTGSQYYSLKDITSSVIAGTYTVTNSDFLKTLVYTGTDNIDLLLNLSLNFVEGTSIKLLQKSSGQITVIGSGVIISTTTDVVATTYGINSIIDILVYSASIPEVILSGKLKLI